MGGGQMQQAYVRKLRAQYMRMRDSAIEQQIEGFGQWEFLQQVGVTLIGEARDVYDEFMENWDALNPACTNKRQPKMLRWIEPVGARIDAIEPSG